MSVWSQYKKTMIPTQALILSVTAILFYLSHLPNVAFTFFMAMQSGALIGAAWAVRLRKKIARDAGLVI